MKTKHFLFTGLVLALFFAFTAAALAGLYDPKLQDSGMTLVDTVRDATEQFQDMATAEYRGYRLFHGCVSGPQQGAMGIHLANGDLVSDGALDPTRPEALLYEFKNGQMLLAAVEFVVLADAWHAETTEPPVLMGQLFNYVSSPNRYGLPAFYELHVWAWKQNPLGTFADWNPRVSCDEYVTGASDHQTYHRGGR